MSLFFKNMSCFDSLQSFFFVVGERGIGAAELKKAMTTKTHNAALILVSKICYLFKEFK